MTMYKKYAELLVHYSLDLKKGQKLLISSTYLAEPLVKEVYREALLVGAHPETMIGLNGLNRVLFNYGDPLQLGHVSPLYRYAVEHYDAFLTIRAPFNLKELEGIEAEKKRMANEAQAAVKALFMKRASTGKLTWTLCEFPTEAQAQESGMSREEYERFVFSACYLDGDDPERQWNGLRERQQHLVDYLNERRKMRFVARDTDITFSTRKRRWINSDGHHNMPSGEVFTSPVETSVEGVVRFSYPGIFMGEEIENVSLEVHHGEVTGWDADKGRKLLDSILLIPGMKRFGEAAIGTNRGITRFTKNMLFDEKMGGTAHMALGASYGETGGKNKSAVHWDLLLDLKEQGEIYADGELIYAKGSFLI
jgi:aminopeptidase